MKTWVDTSHSQVFLCFVSFVLLKSQFDLNAAKMVQKVNITTRLIKSSSVLSFSLDKSFKHSAFADRLTALIHLTSGLVSKQKAAEEWANQAENQRHLCRQVRAVDEKSCWFLDVCCKQSIQFV